MKCKKEKEGQTLEARRSECLLFLPGFLSQLLLLLNSGMVLQSAFFQIADSYENLPEARRNSFTEAVCRIALTSRRTGENAILLFYNYGRSSGVKELTRVAVILSENMNRGTDLWERLAEESEQLWQERKRVTLEKIRVSESKMSFPLGLLMISLLLVTAAPAMMQL